MFEGVGNQLVRVFRRGPKPEGAIGRLGETSVGLQASLGSDVFAPTGREIQAKRLAGSGDAGDLADLASAHLDTPELFDARAAAYGDFEQLFLGRPDVAGTLELVRQFHVQDMPLEVERGLRRAIEVMLGNPDFKGLGALREADAIAALALVTGHEAEARRALKLVRPEASVDKHLQRLKGELPTQSRPTASRRKPFSVLLERERERMAVLVSNQGAQTYPARLQAVDAIQNRKHPRLAGVRRLIELNPKYDKELRFIEACLQIAPSRARLLSLEFMQELGETARPRTQSVEQVVRTFQQAGEPDDPRLGKIFLELFPEYRVLEDTRQRLKAHLLAGNPDIVQHRNANLGDLMRDNGLLSWLETRFRNTPTDSALGAGTYLYPPLDDKILMRRFHSRFARSLAAKPAVYLDRPDLAKELKQLADKLMDESYPLNRQERRVEQRLAAAETDAYWATQAEGHAIAKHITEADKARMQQEQAQRLASPAGLLLPSAKGVDHALAGVLAEARQLSYTDPARAVAVLDALPGMREALGQTAAWKDLRPLLRLADAEAQRWGQGSSEQAAVHHANWSQLRQRLFEWGAGTVTTPEQAQESAWFSRFMGLSGVRLPALDPAFGRAMAVKYLESEAKSKVAFAGVLDALKAQGLAGPEEKAFWMAWLKRQPSVTIADMLETGPMFERMQAWS